MTAPGTITIAIPTYNRPEPLRRCLEALLPQLTSECWLLISDNCSDVPVATIVVPLLEQYGWKQFRLHRHEFNKGAHGNLHYCFESTSTEWIWVLGDDDVPADDAIQTILTSVQTCPDALALTCEVQEFRKFIGGSPPVEELHFNKLEDYLASDALYCSSLISSLILNVPKARKGVAKGYEFGSSYFPHLAWIIFSMQKHGGCVVYSPKQLVKFIADGASEMSLYPILPNLRYLTRMLESVEARICLMNNSYMRTFVGPWHKRIKSPSFVQIVIATAFRHVQSGSDVIRRARRVCGESFEFDQIASPLPLAGMLMCLQFLMAVSAGCICGPLIRVLYRAKNRTQPAPTLLESVRQPLVP